MEKIIKLLFKKYGRPCCFSINYWHYAGNPRHEKEYVIYIEDIVHEEFTDKSKAIARLRELLRG